MTVLPWTYETRPDTRTTNVRLGVWLFLASEAMFFGSLFSAYVLLREGGATWPDGSLLSGVRVPLAPTLMLLMATALVRRQPWFTTLFGALFLVAKLLEFMRVAASGQTPASNVLIACWFVLAGLHWLHVAAGVAATAWVTRSHALITPRHHAERVHAVWLYWWFVDLVWAGILVSFYFN